MKLFCISGVVLLLSVAESKGGTSASEFPCEVRNLTVTVDDYLRLYLDGIEITDLPNADSWSRPDVVDLPCTTVLLAINGRNWVQGAGILASTDDEYVLTNSNSSWKCSNVSNPGWEEIDFDDSTWKPAIAYGRNEESSWAFVPGISTNAFWIWLRPWISDDEEMDMDVYCRKRLAVNACDSNPCLNGGTCYSVGGDSFSCTCPIYVTGLICESPNYNEAYACGTTLSWSEYPASNGFTRLCYFWTNVEDTEGRHTECRNTINGIPLYGDYTGLMEAGGNFGCIISQAYPDDLPATSLLSCADNYQQDVSLGNFTVSDRMMVCIRYPYEGVPGRK